MKKISTEFGALGSELAAVHVELWHEEDKARSPDDAQVCRAKRRIDVLNQKRNDLIERIDERTQELAGKPGRTGAKRG